MDELWNNIEFHELANKVEERLDEIFKGIVIEPEEQKQSDNDLILNHLNKLNKILLSIEPENAGEQIVKVLQLLQSIEKIYKEEKHVLMLIRLQINLCNHIKVHKKEAHPLSLKLLRTIFNNLCDIIYAKNISKADIKRIVNINIIRYNKLHELIKNRQHYKKHKSVTRLSKRKTITHEPFKAINQENAQMYVKESLEMRLFFETIISDMKEFIGKELEKLKTELLAGSINK